MMLYYGYRYYDAVSGRWASRDPIGERGGENLYALARNDPICSTDELGLVVHLAPLNGEAENHSSQARIIISGDWKEIDFAGPAATVFPWSYADEIAQIASLLKHGMVMVAMRELAGTHELSPGLTMHGEWSAGKTRIVDSDFLTGSTQPVYEDKRCCKLAKLPVKIGAGILTVQDCVGKPGVWYDIDAKFRPW